MQGLNKAFLLNPATFLRTRPLRVQARTDQNSPFAALNYQKNPPIFDFDLQHGNVGVTLIPFIAHAKTHTFGTQRPISAYWLDYESRVTSVIQLGNQANYLFTPMLDGCYIGVGNGAITHVAGDVSGRGNTQTMRQLAANALGGNVAIGFDSNIADAGQVTFIGVRSGGTWSFYVQGHGYFYNMNGALENVFNNTQDVLQLTDLTYG